MANQQRDRRIVGWGCGIVALVVVMYASQTMPILLCT